MDYYSTLGVGKNATDDDIKKAYRKLAMKHHPDRGGDESTFKKISEAYDVLSDPQKKQIVDLGGDPKNQGNGNSFNQGPFEFHFNTGGVPPGMEDIFGRFGFGSGFGRQPMQKNKTLNINVDITLEDVLSGRDINAEITIPSTGKRKMINIAIPAGIEHGQQIRYEGMGDDAIRELRPGDLIVNVNVQAKAVQRPGHLWRYSLGKRRKRSWRLYRRGCSVRITLWLRPLITSSPCGYLLPAQPSLRSATSSGQSLHAW